MAAVGDSRQRELAHQVLWEVSGPLRDLSLHLEIAVAFGGEDPEAIIRKSTQEMVGFILKNARSEPNSEARELIKKLCPGKFVFLVDKEEGRKSFSELEEEANREAVLRQLSTCIKLKEMMQRQQELLSWGYGAVADLRQRIPEYREKGGQLSQRIKKMEAALESAICGPEKEDETGFVVVGNSKVKLEKELELLRAWKEDPTFLLSVYNSASPTSSLK
jgi:hypothetical protein